MTTIDELIQAQVVQAVAAVTSGIAKGDPGDEGPQGPAGDGHFPGWLSDGQFDSGCVDFLARRLQLQQRLLLLPRPTGQKVPADQSIYPGGYGNHSYCDVTAMADGDSFLIVPFNRSTGFIYRASTRRFTPIPSIDGPVPSGQSNGVLLRSSRILMCPYSQDRLLAYNPLTEQIETLKTGLSGLNKWSGMATAKGGIAYASPHQSKRIGIYDENAMAGSQWRLSNQDLSIVDYAYGGAPIPLPDGKLLFIPYNETRAMIFDPVSGIATLGAPGKFPGNESFWNGRLLTSIKVLLYPHKHDRPVIYDFVSDTVTPFPGVTGTLNVSNFNGGVWLADSRDALIPYRSGRCVIIDTNNNMVHFPPGSYVDGACKGGALMADGNALMAPFNADTPMFLMTGTGARLDPELITSPHMNR